LLTLGWQYLVKLPFPLTPQFKSMLQAGVGTRDLDVRWVSSISWYFLTLFGLQPVYNFILGSNQGLFLSSSSLLASPHSMLLIHPRPIPRTSESFPPFFVLYALFKHTRNKPRSLHNLTPYLLSSRSPSGRTNGSNEPAATRLWPRAGSRQTIQERGRKPRGLRT